MDENYRTIYRILKTLEGFMDVENPDFHSISAEALQISQQRWTHIIEMLIDEDYIKGISITRDVAGNTFTSLAYPRITLKGLEYLSENSLMKRVQKTIRGVVEIIPSI